MIFDVDVFHATNHGLDLLERLKEINPLFRMTAFAVPAYCPPSFLDSLPPWIEVVPHGWNHGGPACGNPREAENWTREQTIDVLLSLHDRFEDGWKSPGWQISDGTYMALYELDYWVADQHYNDHRRPVGLRVHCEGDGDHLHCHVQDWGSNGLQESWDTIVERVEPATSFELVSDVVQPWIPEPVAA